MKTNWKINTLPRKLTPEQIVERLLTLQQEQNQWLQEVQASGHLEIKEPIAQNYLLLHLALDILGVPPTNLPKDHSMPCVGEQFSRDWLVDLYEVMFERDHDLRGFIEIASGRCEVSDESMEKVSARLHDKG